MAGMNAGGVLFEKQEEGKYDPDYKGLHDSDYDDEKDPDQEEGEYVDMALAKVNKQQHDPNFTGAVNHSAHIVLDDGKVNKETKMVKQTFSTDESEENTGKPFRPPFGMSGGTDPFSKMPSNSVRGEGGAFGGRPDPFAKNGKPDPFAKMGKPDPFAKMPS